MSGELVPFEQVERMAQDLKELEKLEGVTATAA